MTPKINNFYGIATAVLIFYSIKVDNLFELCF